MYNNLLYYFNKELWYKIHHSSGIKHNMQESQREAKDNTVFDLIGARGANVNLFYL